MAALARASAQVNVDVTLDQENYLPGETIEASVRVTNLSGQTLHLGTDADWLSFTLESRDGEVVARTGEVPVTGEFTLESSKAAIKHVNLAPYFSLDQPGRYNVTAGLKVKKWGFETVSRPKSFDIVRAARLWDQDFGVPSTSSTNSTPEVRKYILEEANYLRGQLRLYFRLTDPSGATTFRVTPIGTLLSFSRWQALVDKDSRLHVLYQCAPRAYSYSVFQPSGVQSIRQFHEFTETRPRLEPGSDGSVAVVGGARRVTALDIPAPPMASLEAGPKPITTPEEAARLKIPEFSTPAADSVPVTNNAPGNAPHL